MSLSVPNVDPVLLHKQYLTLLHVRNQSLKLERLDKEAPEDFEGLLNFFEELFEQNPEQFPTSETKKR